MATKSIVATAVEMGCRRAYRTRSIVSKQVKSSLRLQQLHATACLIRRAARHHMWVGWQKHVADQQLQLLRVGVGIPA